MSVNNNDCTRMSRIEAWNFMKKLSDGSATLIVRQKIPQAQAAAATADKDQQQANNKPQLQQQQQSSPSQQKKLGSPSSSVEEKSKKNANSSNASNNSGGDSVTPAGAKMEEGTTKVDRTVEETKHI